MLRPAAAVLVCALAGTAPAAANTEKPEQFHTGLYDALAESDPAARALDPARLAALQRRDLCANGPGPLTSLRERIAAARDTVARATAHRSRDLAIYTAFEAGELVTGADADLIDSWLRDDQRVSLALTRVADLERAADRAAPTTADDQLRAADKVEELVVATTAAAAAAGRQIALALADVDTELALMLDLLRNLDPAIAARHDLWPPVEVCPNPDTVLAPPPVAPQPSSSCASCAGGPSDPDALLPIIVAVLALRRSVRPVSRPT